MDIRTAFALLCLLSAASHASEFIRPIHDAAGHGAFHGVQSIGTEPTTESVFPALNSHANPAGFNLQLPPPDPRLVLSFDKRSQFLAALAQGDWTGPFLNDANALQFAHGAYRQAEISAGQLATVLMRAAAFEDFRPVLQDQVPHAILDASGRLTPNMQRIIVHEKGLNESQRRDFEQRIRALPASEQFLWIRPISSYNLRRTDYDRWAGFSWKRASRMASFPRNEDYAGSLRSLGPALKAMRFFWEDMFLSIHSPQPRQFDRYDNIAIPNFLPIPTLGVMQSLLDAKFGSNALRLRPTVGATTVDELLEMTDHNERVLGVHFPGGKTPTVAHDYDVGKILFTYHDALHAWGGSRLPPSYRRGIVRVHTVLKEMNVNLAPESLLIQGFTDLNLLEPENNEPFILWLKRDLFKIPDVWAHLPTIVRDMEQNPAIWHAIGHDVRLEIAAAKSLLERISRRG